MSGFNRVTLLGNLGADPEIKTMNSGDRIANLRIATSETWKDKQSGERKERTEWHRVVIFNDNLVKIAEQYLRKGSTVLLEGQLQTRKWQDQSGQDRYSTEVVIQRFGGSLTMVGPKRDGDDGERYASHQTRGGGNQSRHTRDNGGFGGGGGDGGFGGLPEDLDDEIPFGSPYGLR